MKKIITLLLVFVFVNCHAQTVDSFLNIVASNYNQEKTFIHFDREVYSKGETIWFKAYLYADNLPSVISKNFYTDWFNDSGVLISHDVYPINWASCNGQFEIPNDYGSKKLHLVAYTTWMQNFDTAFLFKKSFSIFNLKDSFQSTSSIKTAIQFFPEGGNVINGISSFIAFKATNQFGLPVKVKGIIKNENGEIIDSIKTDHDGMGLFYHPNPLSKNVYTAYWQDEYGIEKTTILPLVLKSGVALQIEQLGKFIKAKVERTDDVGDDMKFIRIFCTIGSDVVYNARLKLTNNKSNTLDIPIGELPTGVLQVTIFNDNYLPLAERLVFINNENYTFKSNINFLQKNFIRRGKNTFEVEVEDSSITNMSIAITDFNAITDSANNIYSNLLLTSDIKGYVHNPAYYFNEINEDKKLQLDLVMLTNGWRKYDWQKISKGTFPYIRYKRDTSYLNLIGTLLEDQTKLLPNQEVVLFTETKDSVKKQFYLPVNRKGIFAKNNLIFYGDLKVHYFFLNNKKMSTSEVAFQNGLFNYYSKSFTDTLIKRNVIYNPAFVARMKNWQEEYKRLMKIKGSGALEELVVEAKKKKPIDVLNDKYTSGFFSGGDAVQFDLVNDVSAQGAIDIFQYLTGRVAGLQINNSSFPPSLTWRGGTPTVFLDEIQSNVETIQTLNVQDIAYIKAFRPPFFGAIGGGSGGAIAIYTKKGDDIKANTKGVPFKIVKGYNIVKQFYSPNYEKETQPTDNRTTLYWNPYITTNKQHKKVELTFFNNDISKKLKVVMCGMNMEGKMCWIEKIIE